MTRLLLITFSLLALTALYIQPDRGFGLSAEEGAALYVVRDDLRFDVTPRDALRAVRDDLRQWVDRVQAQPQPPLYFLLLNTWEWLAGESIVALRWSSTLLVLLAVTTMTAAAGLRSRLRAGGWLTLLFAGVMLAFYAAHTVYTYPLLLALAALGIWALAHWARGMAQGRGGGLWLGFYTLTLAAGLYTHHAAAVLVGVQVLYLLTLPHARRLFVRWVAAVVVATVLFTPWLLIAPPDVDALSQGHGLRQTLLGAWFAALPGLMLLIGVLLARAARSAQPAAQQMAVPLVLAVSFMLGLTTNLGLLADHCDCETLIADFNAARQPLEPAIIDLPPQHPLWHYDRLSETRWRPPLAVEVDWRPAKPASLAAIVARLGDGPVWLVVDSTRLTRIAQSLVESGRGAQQPINACPLRIQRYIPMESPQLPADSC
ncbi:MAG: hypothetical protein ACOCYT_00255 [Chloroflexota bacterium]